ncbi:MAG TPA: asparagine synthase C-terminal domain-containing protein [Methanocorpusculum sp.]|nr:asparagine synthase C-terminal domain-containing protein [Methanocorpusculum sp.]
MIRGWVEQNGRILGAEADTLSTEELLKCGGEFYSPDLQIRDKYGIFPAPECQRAAPQYAPQQLSDAIKTAVLLRSTPDSVVTLSGGVDSSLVAAISGLPAICVGAENSSDVVDAEHFADEAGLKLSVHTVTKDEVESALPSVLAAIPSKDPVSLEIALTGFFVARTAKERGAARIVTGQAADELFAGYARYGQSANLRADLDKDFALLAGQRARDFAVADLFGVWYSLPYMDERVVSIARSLPSDALVLGDLRKIALRRAAESFLPEEIAWKPKKAMQYGSGVSKLLARIAKEQGVKGTSGLIELFKKDGGE